MINPADSTKPSRINRKRKRRWIKNGLTDCARLAQNLPAGEASPVGFAAGISLGVQSPLKTVVFLCQKISTVIQSAESYCYGVVIWGVERLAAPRRGTANPLNHAARCFAVIGGGKSFISLGVTA